jgi:hypothetical protein
MTKDEKMQITDLKASLDDPPANRHEYSVHTYLPLAE